MDATNSTPYDPCKFHPSLASRAVFGSALISVAVMGTIGNSILSLYVIRNIEMRSLINILLATMAVSDTLISFACTPLDILTIIIGRWPLGATTCLAHSFVLSVLVVENVTVLVVISLDRYCLLVLKKDKFSGCHGAALISACTVFSVVVSMPPLFNWGRLIFANAHCRKMYDNESQDHIYPLLYSSLLLLFPCGLLLLAYIHIIAINRKKSLRVHPDPSHRMSASSVEKFLRVHVKFKQKTFSTILCLYTAAVVCRLPLAFSIFVRSLTTYAVCALSHWFMLLTYVNSAVNPFIYALKISEYWLMLTGKLNGMGNRVTRFKNKRSRKRDQPQNVYMINMDSPPYGIQGIR